MENSPSPLLESTASPAPGGPSHAPAHSRKPGLAFHLFFGVLLPVAAFGIEAVTGICASEFFDPMPTVAHTLLIAWVPIANAWMLACCWQGGARRVAPKWGRGLEWANAFAAGIALCYAGLYLPMLPFALIGVIFFGIGLLPLAPLLALISALRLRKVWRRSMPEERPAPQLSAWHIGWGVLAVAGVTLPGFVTEWSVGQVAREDHSPVALAWLRHAADESRLLRGAHAMGAHWTFFGMFKSELTPANYAVAYYRATGKISSQTRAAGRQIFSGREDENTRWEWDDALGEQQVGLRRTHLKLIESTLDAAVSADDATAYTEWTMVFRNEHEFQQAEARALVQLPPGGVVSRLTLWIDGEEREAAFGGRSQVTQAYKAVVSQRRDPVLVTDKGADRVLMQCFPISPNNGEMKVRLGVTYPLALADERHARVMWPRVIEQNFVTREKFAHALWVSKAGVVSEIGTLRRAASDGVRGEILATEFAQGAGTLLVERGRDETVYDAVPDGSHRRVRQEVEKIPGAGDALAVVLDGSASMAATGEAFARALMQLPPATRIEVWFAGDTVRRSPQTTPAGVAAWVREQRFTGGQDDTAALIAAYDSVAGRERATVLWIHGPQPHTWMQAAPLGQRFARGGGSVALVDYSAGWGENPRFEELAASAPVRRIEPLGAVTKTELSRVLREVLEPRWVTVRTLDAGIDAAPGARQIGRLWVKEEVDRLMRQTPARQAEAVQLARKSRLVTAVTGAVVLETQAQYDAAGLKPGESPDTPSIPEPASVALVGGALALVAAWRWRCRLAANAALERKVGTTGAGCAVRGAGGVSEM